MDVMLMVNERDTQRAWELVEAHNRSSQETETLAEYLERMLSRAIQLEHINHEQRKRREQGGNDESDV